MATTAEEIRSYIRRQEEKPSSHCRFLRDDALFWHSKREVNAGSPLCRKTRREVEEQNERRDQAGWPGSVGTRGAREIPDSQLRSPANF